MEWTQPTSETAVRADIAAAQRRSALYGVDRHLDSLPFRGEQSAAGAELQLMASPVLEDFLPQIAEASFAAVLTGPDGQVILRHAGDASTKRAIGRYNIDVGFSLAEPDAGTNGAGTALETRRPAMVIGSDHFVETFHRFACASSPIVHPVSHKVLGTVGLLCSVEDASPLLLPSAVQLARSVAGRYLDGATEHERILLDAFLRRRRHGREALAAVSSTALIATPPAQDLLQGVNPDELWEVALAAVVDRRAVIDLPRWERQPLELRCEAIHRGDELCGVMISMTVQRAGDTIAAPPTRTLGQLVGVSDQWRAVVRTAHHAGARTEPVLIVGERGTGRRSVAEAIVGLDPRLDAVVFDSADVLVQGPKAWVGALRRVRGSHAVVILRRVDQLPAPVAAAVARQVTDPESDVRFIGTADDVQAHDPGAASLLDQLDVLRIEIPPLRARRDDIAPIVRAIADRQAQGRVSPEVISLLYRQPWPGNVTELRQALRSGFSRAGGQPLSIEHLPDHIRRTKARAPLHGLRQQEAQAIIEAIDATRGNKSQAAALLGISRATLYRRLDAYGIELDT